MNVTTETFERDVIQRSHEIPVVVDFWAEWCGPCRRLGPAIESEIAKRPGQVELAKVDVEVEREIAATFGIQSIPTVVAFRDGQPVKGFIGAVPPRAIAQFLDEHVLAVEQASSEVAA